MTDADIVIGTRIIRKAEDNFGMLGGKVFIIVKIESDSITVELQDKIHYLYYSVMRSRRSGFWNRWDVYSDGNDILKDLCSK